MDLISRLRTGALLGLRDATAFTPAPAGVEDQDQTQDGQEEGDHAALRGENGDGSTESKEGKWRREENTYGEWLTVDHTDAFSTTLTCTDELNPSPPCVIISPFVQTGSAETSVPEVCAAREDRKGN